jgi:hypothetical protein
MTQLVTTTPPPQTAQTAAQTTASAASAAASAALAQFVPDSARESPAVLPAAPVAVEPVGWDAHVPKLQVRSAAERIAAKRATEAERAKMLPIQQQHQELQERYAQVTTSQHRADTEFQRLVDAGDIDGAFKVKGLSVTFDDLQRKMLVAAGALPPPDPRYDALKRELETEREARTRLAQEAQARDAKQRDAQQWDQDVRDIRTELGALDLPGAASFAGAPGAAESVTRLVAQQGLTLQQAAATVYQDYRTLYQELRQAFESDQPRIAETPSVRPLVNGETSPPRSGVQSETMPSTGVRALPSSRGVVVAPQLSSNPRERAAQVVSMALNFKG